MFRDNLESSKSPRQDYATDRPERQGESPYRPEYEEYVRLYTGRGTLKIQLSVARGAYPIRNAMVDVAQIYNGVRYSLYTDVTDISGIVDNMALPARDIGSTLNYEEGPLPEAEYMISIYHPDFQEIKDRGVVIHDKIETILPISLVPVTREGG